MPEEPPSATAGQNTGAGTIALCLAADIREIAALAAALDRFGTDNGIAPEAIFKVKLVLDELINNVIDHGMVSPRDGRIDLGISLEGSSLVIDMTDNARLYDPFLTAPPDVEADMDSRPIGGLGVHIVRSLMSEASYSASEGRNHIRLRLDLA